MRKVYLVICYMTAEGQNFEYIADAYLSKKKAEVYCEYCNLKMGYATDDKTKGYRVEDYLISHIDWTDDLAKLKMERNPL